MRKIKVLKRKLSLGEILENQRKAQDNTPTDTRTYSVKVATGWYKIYQKKSS